MALHVRAKGDPEGVAAPVRGAITSLERNLPVFDLRPMSALLSDALFPARMGAILLGAFGIIALVLAAVGVYGVTSYSVARRTREVGIRMALGARRSDVLRLVLKEGLVTVGIGVAVGLVAAWSITYLLASFLYGVSVTDPATFAVISLLMIGSALGATLVPARRATKVDPLVALRYE
jgi:putative ABC transport system permease protein